MTRGDPLGRRRRTKKGGKPNRFKMDQTGKGVQSFSLNDAATQSKNDEISSSTQTHPRKRPPVKKKKTPPVSLFFFLV